MAPTCLDRRGSGLGLAVVRMVVVDALRGEVSAEESPGGGARFVVRVPAVATVEYDATVAGAGEGAPVRV